MILTDDERVSTQDPFFARSDCELRNYINRTNLKLSNKEEVLIDDIKNDIVKVYFRRKIFLNFNKKEAVIKVTKPKIEDKLGDSLIPHRDLMIKLDKLGVTHKQLKNGNLIFYIPRFP